ncbi:MAG: GyrI-like domain-containing protein [Myxococcales bacterium]|nr:GyrI-like domain-containing protein [Myxococcales bacterium]
MAIHCQIEDMPFRYAMVIKAQAKMMQMPKLIGQAFQRIAEYLQAQGVEMKQAPFTKYHGFSWDDVGKQNPLKMLWRVFTYTWHFEIGFPLEAPLAAPAGMECAEYPFDRVVACLHEGPYQKIGATYKAFYNRMLAEQMRPLDFSFEIYLNDPRTTPPKELQTKIMVPLAEA